MNGVSNLREQAYWDDEIDLRHLVETLLRHKWVIVGLVVAATAVAGIYSYFILPPRYEAVMTVALPAADGADGVGMSVAADGADGVGMSVAAYGADGIGMSVAAYDAF